MGIVVSSCKSKSSIKNEISPRLKLNRNTPTKREQRFKTYKFSNRSKKTRQLDEKSPNQNSSEKFCYCKSLDCLNKIDKFCQVDIDTKKDLIHRTTSTNILPLESLSGSPTREKMSHRRPKNNDLHRHYHHHHHHYHHRKHKINFDCQDIRDSPTISLLSDLEAEYCAKPNLSIFSNLYNQGNMKIIFKLLCVRGFSSSHYIF